LENGGSMTGTCSKLWGRASKLTPRNDFLSPFRESGHPLPSLRADREKIQNFELRRTVPLNPRRRRVKVHVVKLRNGQPLLCFWLSFELRGNIKIKWRRRKVKSTARTSDSVGDSSAF
jgi:hypothetical protein